MHAQATPTPSPPRAGLDDVFLDRLRALVARQRAALTPAERAALSIATFSTFLDCLDLGRHAEARALLEELHAAGAPAGRGGA